MTRQYEIIHFKYFVCWRHLVQQRGTHVSNIFPKCYFLIRNFSTPTAQTSAQTHPQSNLPIIRELGVTNTQLQKLGTNSRPHHAAWSALRSQMRTPKPRDAHVIASDRIHPSWHTSRVTHSQPTPPMEIVGLPLAVRYMCSSLQLTLTNSMIYGPSNVSSPGPI